jgi:hypothetical protein
MADEPARPTTPLWLTVVGGALAGLGVIWVLQLIFSIALGLLKFVVVLLVLVVVGYLAVMLLTGGRRRDS